MRHEASFAVNITQILAAIPVVMISAFHFQIFEQDVERRCIEAGMFRLEHEITEASGPECP
jgi:hypothetical protein